MRQITIKLGGLPDDFENIVSAEDVEKSKQIVEKICMKLKNHAQKCLDNGITGNGVKIPYSLILSSSLSSSDSWSMTILSRLLNYIAIITKVNMDSRPKVVDIETEVFYPISIYDDLKEALEIMRTASLSIRPYQQDWYTNVFLPAYGELGPEPNCKLSEYDGRVISRENIIGLTTKQLADKMSEQGVKTSTGNVYENFLRPLTKQGIINSVQSVINGKEHLYYPVNFGDDNDGDLSTSLLPLTEDCRLIITKPFDEKKILEESLGTLIGRRCNGCGSKYKIIDIDGSELCLSGLIEKYFFSSKYHTSCSVVLTKSYNNSIEQYSMLDEKQTKDDKNDGEELDISSNNVVKEATNTNASPNSTTYPYSEEDIDNFFAPEFEQQKGHPLKKSVCELLIGMQKSEPFFYYCKQHPEVENTHLESIEGHIRLKDPELHKRKLLELVDREKENNEN